MTLALLHHHTNTMKYKLLDTQHMGTFKNIIFNSKEDVREQLASYHSVDWTEENDINTLSLDDLLDYGEWELLEVFNNFIKCPLCREDSITYKSWLSTYIYTCSDCPFLSFEYINDKDLENLQDYLKFN